MVVFSATRIGALAHLRTLVRATARSLRAHRCTLERNHGTEVTPMRYRAEASIVGRLPAFVAWLLAALLVAATFAAGQAPAQDKPPIADSAITLQVQRAIAQHRDLARLHIEVRTEAGMVNLTGFVRSLEDIARAGEVARGVRGVTGIRNGLQVANRPSRA